MFLYWEGSPQVGMVERGFSVVFLVDLQIEVRGLSYLSTRPTHDLSWVVSPRDWDLSQRGRSKLPLRSQAILYPSSSSWAIGMHLRNDALMYEIIKYHSSWPARCVSCSAFLALAVSLQARCSSPHRRRDKPGCFLAMKSHVYVLKSFLK